MAGLQVGQAYGVFHRPGFGLLVSVPRSLSTQPPFATQALTYFNTPLIISPGRGYKKLINDFDTLDEIGGGARSGLDKYLQLPSIKSKNTKIEN